MITASIERYYLVDRYKLIDPSTQERKVTVHVDRRHAKGNRRLLHDPNLINFEHDVVIMSSIHKPAMSDLPQLMHIAHLFAF